jgi:hypothetical protein
MRLHATTVRVAVAISLLLAAVLGGGWKWDGIVH